MTRYLITVEGEARPGIARALKQILRRCNVRCLDIRPVIPCQPNADARGGQRDTSGPSEPATRQDVSHGR